MSECRVCGPLAWRSGSHAEWCDRIRRYLDTFSDEPVYRYASRDEWAA